MSNPKDQAAQNRPCFSRLPLTVIFELIAVFTEGARKYGLFNWRKDKVNETVYVDAAIRHLSQYLAGEDVDPTCGVNHITKAIAGLMILRDAQIHDQSIDDRPVTHKLDLDALAEVIAQQNDGSEYPEDIVGVECPLR